MKPLNRQSAGAEGVAQMAQVLPYGPHQADAEPQTSLAIGLLGSPDIARHIGPIPERGGSGKDSSSFTRRLEKSLFRLK